MDSIVPMQCVSIVNSITFPLHNVTTVTGVQVMWFEMYCCVFVKARRSLKRQGNEDRGRDMNNLTKYIKCGTISLSHLVMRNDTK